MTASWSSSFLYLLAREGRQTKSLVRESPLFLITTTPILTCEAVLPYFPYSRQSKKKSHRGAITARMLANLLAVAGINHVITVDLHASQMQGFFKCPVDNLHAEPLIARWIRHNVKGWREAVCVSKNAGGTKRVTSLADALTLDFGMVTTDRRRGGNMSSSMIMTRLDRNPVTNLTNGMDDFALDSNFSLNGPVPKEPPQAKEPLQNGASISRPSFTRQDSFPPAHRANQRTPPHIRTHSGVGNSPVQRSPLIRSVTTPARSPPIQEETEYTDERAREVTHGRLVQGHIVPDDYPSPTQSAMSGSIILEQTEDDPMEMSRASSFFTSEPHALGGIQDATASSDEEEESFNNPSLEQMITLVGNVKDKTVFIIDDMIDKAGSWIAAAETVVKRGGAKKVYCIATHGLFGGDSLEELQDCDCIDTIVVTNSFPIPAEKARAAKKLVIIDLSYLLAEAIRRNHYGESISALFQHISD
jgi:ribose-phosphate pyrophosphokinase